MRNVETQNAERLMLNALTENNAQFNSSTADERIATQECSTGVTEAGIQKNSELTAISFLYN